MIVRGLLFAALLISATSAQARVFNINNETFAAYFDVSAGPSAIGTGAFDGEATGLSYSGGSGYNYSGEFGFLYTRQYMSLRFGLEIIRPSAIEGSSATNASETELYTADSQILGYAPKLGVEFNLQSNARSRSFVALGVGAASVTMKNSYTLTTDGQTAFPGVSNHDVEAKGSGTLLNASLGYEGLLTDTTTIVVEMGYRQLNIENLEYTKSVTTFKGPVNSGDKVTTAAGEQRDLNLSGAFIAIGFRFYL
ncbi:hypothetical protein [Bdellovibrio bacteriovorus]|uniref:Outer membrane protein beta-barrel domain-containing protein n=1 Tax=Bdellovibrio bacteriovorus str. Tiberius TaxID=1069642 RepID=K7Z153_BDEBC|nr:hypothetical protein [Bdellovibrio bacteriovorus]AFY02770.1 hypothetical protein Bdt_3095 [Bdellovibrio bacteriovorus str. Tiberius]